MNGLTGEITSKSVRSKDIPSQVVINGEYTPELSWVYWQVKLDKTGKLQTFTEVELQKIE